MREVELKSAAERPDAVVAALLAGGANSLFTGRLSDRRYDRPDRTLLERDVVLRLRTWTDDRGERSNLEWKGPTGYANGYKVRDELATGVADVRATASVLEQLGYIVIREIDREIAQFALASATVRIERYPRMDTLVEIEGPPDAIEHAISVSGLPRSGFTSERLPDFIRRFEARTGQRAAICDRELSGDYRFSAADA
jgi:predicted adenylyl cyclase CyaB